MLSERVHGALVVAGGGISAGISAVFAQGALPGLDSPVGAIGQGGVVAGVLWLLWKNTQLNSVADQNRQKDSQALYVLLAGKIDDNSKKVDDNTKVLSGVVAAVDANTRSNDALSKQIQQFAFDRFRMSAGKSASARTGEGTP